MHAGGQHVLLACSIVVLQWLVFTRIVSAALNGLEGNGGFLRPCGMDNAKITRWHGTQVHMVVSQITAKNSGKKHDINHA